MGKAPSKNVAAESALVRPRANSGVVWEDGRVAIKEVHMGQAERDLVKMKVRSQSFSGVVGIPGELAVEEKAGVSAAKKLMGWLTKRKSRNSGKKKGVGAAVVPDKAARQVGWVGPKKVAFIMAPALKAELKEYCEKELAAFLCAFTIVALARVLWKRKRQN